MSVLGDAAVDYARLGWRVFPLKPRDKKPYFNSNGLLDAAADPQLVAAWWAGKALLPAKDADKPQSRPAGNANIGVATGSASGFWVLDVDGPEAAEALWTLQVLHGRLSGTVRQTTGKGSHYLFAWPRHLAALGRDIRNTASKVGPGIDVRGEGGYIVAAPSIHPSGRLYAWGEGEGPRRVTPAAAPGWLLDLVAPAEAPKPAPAERPRRPVEQGRATPYGEAALANACREITSAPKGRQNSTLWIKACAIGELVAGEEIERAYGERALVDAGLGMAAHGKPWTPQVVEDTVRRGFIHTEGRPRRAPERRERQRASLAPAAQSGRHADGHAETAADIAADVLEARRLWASAIGGERVARSVSVNAWFAAWRLRPGDAPGALARLRLHYDAPYGGGVRGPALIAPLTVAPGDGVDAVAVLPLQEACPRFTRQIGDVDGKAVILSDLTPPEPSSPLIVTLDLQDGWRLCADAIESGLIPRLVIAPSLRALAGQALGDRFGRVDPDMAKADPAAPPWTWPNAGSVLLALRRDLCPVRVRRRKVLGGTAPVWLHHETVARFYGALAEQAWRRAGANPVRTVLPTSGDGFNEGRL